MCYYSNFLCAIFNRSGKQKQILRCSILLRNNSPLKVSKLVVGEVKEVEVGIVNTHLATWYSETEAKWSQVMNKSILDIFVTAITGSA